MVFIIINIGLDLARTSIEIIFELDIYFLIHPLKLCIFFGCLKVLKDLHRWNLIGDV